MRRTMAGAIGVVLLVLLAGCAGVTGGTGDGTAADDLERSVDVTAAGEASAEPDRAIVLLVVEATGGDAGTVRNQLANEDERLRSALIDWGLDEDAISTERFEVRESRETRGDPNRSAYVGEHLYAVEVDDVDAVGEVVDVGVDAGADGVRYIQFGLSDELESELREEALANAMDSARAEATVLADSADLELTGVYAVSTGDTRTDPFRASGFQEAGDAAAGGNTGVEVGDVDVSVRVSVLFEAEQA